MEGGCVALQPSKWAGDNHFVKVIFGSRGCFDRDVVLVLGMVRVSDWCFNAHDRLVEVYVDLSQRCFADILQDTAVS